MGWRANIDWLAALTGEPSVLFRKTDYEEALEELDKDCPGAPDDVLTYCNK